MKKFFTKKRTSYLIIAIIGALFITFSLIYENNCFVNYTDEYNLYCNIKELSDLTEIRNTLQAENIEYTIANNSITLEDYSLISFSKKTDGLWSANEHSMLSCFEKIDKEILSEVTIMGTQTSSGKIVEEVRIKHRSGLCIKNDSNFYYYPFEVVGCMLLSSLTIFLIFATLFTLSTISFFSKKKKLTN